MNDLSFLPIYVPLAFIGAVIMCAAMFMRMIYHAYEIEREGVATENMMITVIVICMWLSLQAWLSAFKVYANEEQIPPPLMVYGVLPMFLFIGYLMIFRKRDFVSRLPLENLTLIHTVRILVEVVLYWLNEYREVPDIMTFRGHNYDIFAGLTAPLMVWLYFDRKVISKQVLLIWNLICLALLLNIIITGILSVSSPIQKLAFDMPNHAVLYFPFVWLPVFIVPVVLFSHLASIWQIVYREKPHEVILP